MCAITSAELPDHVLDMRACGFGCDVQSLGDLVRGRTQHHEVEHLLLPRGEQRAAVRRRIDVLAAERWVDEDRQVQAWLDVRGGAVLDEAALPVREQQLV